MLAKSASIYLRQEFTLDAPLPSRLTLRMKYDDGYVAYINGQEVASSNAPASPSWESLSTRGRVDSVALGFEDVGIALDDGVLQVGRNVLAIHGLNRAPRDADFLILPVLEIAPPNTPPNTDPASRPTNL